MSYRSDRTLGGDRSPQKTTFNHDGLLLDMACWLDAADQDLYGHYMQVLWRLMKEMQEAAKPTHDVRV